MEYQDSELVQELRKNSYYKAQKREKFYTKVTLIVIVLAVIYFLGRTFITFYPAL